MGPEMISVQINKLLETFQILFSLLLFLNTDYRKCITTTL